MTTEESEWLVYITNIIRNCLLLFWFLFVMILSSVEFKITLKIWQVSWCICSWIASQFHAGAIIFAHNWLQVLDRCKNMSSTWVKRGQEFTYYGLRRGAGNIDTKIARPPLPNYIPLSRCVAPWIGSIEKLSFGIWFVKVHRSRVLNLTERIIGRFMEGNASPMGAEFERRYNRYMIQSTGEHTWTTDTLQVIHLGF